MINGKNVLGFIPARLGSKGVPKKNIKFLTVKPLIEYSVEAGNQSKHIDHLIVSIDSEEISKVFKKIPVDVSFIHPDYLASDSKTILRIY